MTLTKNSRLALIAWAVIAAVIIIDQAVKLWVKTHFYLGEDIEILSWFHLRFIQNNGMAFGIELGSKLFLTLFRMVLVGFLVWYIVRLVRAARVPAGYMAAVALVTAGAFGNIVDCVFSGGIVINRLEPPNESFV
ncbi:MAG: signal peptidase II, partial [Muribaculaceae bacterium]|nr:signal peptidase II [Muribaculaceae bacterium]